MSKTIELRPQRNLICNNFDGYKLSLESIPIFRHAITSAPPVKAEPNNEQYSYLHAETFSTQNLLLVDPWERNEAYFINQLGGIVRSCYNENTGRPEPLLTVYTVKTNQEVRPSGAYNYSLRFISEKYCVLCDGIKTLFLLDTGDRRKAAAEWLLVAHTDIVIELGQATNEEKLVIDKNFIIQDARLDIVMEQKKISIALAHVERIDGVGDNDSYGSQHFMQIHWVQWTLENTNWVLKAVDTLQGKGSIYYCAFEPRAESLILSSNREIKFYNEIIKGESNVMEKAKLHDETLENLVKFTWSQNDEDVLIKFDVQEQYSKTNYQIKSTANHLYVKYCEQILLNNELFAEVDEDLTTWSIENNCLHITIIKRQAAFNWSALFSDGTGPKENIDNENQSVPEGVEQQPVVNLEAPIEDCDFPMELNENDVKIERFNLPTKSVTHAVLLGSNPPLFTTILRAGFPNAFAIRQDVDASLWIQQYNPSKPEEWLFRHEGNLHAFGYVQASKQQKKFMDCAPDLSYAIICEASRHIFVYKAKYDTANGLRNRNGPQISLGKQHLLTLEENDEILGLCTACSVVTILTTKNILYLQIGF